MSIIGTRPPLISETNLYELHHVEIAYAYQELNELPEGVELPAGRTKPWGTGHAVLACKEVLHEPFAVINADDYYPVFFHWLYCIFSELFDILHRALLQ